MLSSRKQIIRYSAASIVGGLLFGILDGLINANPLARDLYKVYEPISRTAVNIPAGVAIDLVYGFVLAAVFLLLYKSLPGRSGLIKGISFALLIWFFRVVMAAASSWMMFNLPAATLIYTIVTGLAEMLVLGILFGLVLKPDSQA